MSINRRDIIQMLRDENELLKARNSQVSKKLARQQQAFRVLNELCEKIRHYGGSVDLPTVLNDLLSMVLHTCNAENGSLILLDSDKKELEFVTVIGESHEHLLNHRINHDIGVVGYCIQKGESIVIENVHQSNKWSNAVDERLDFHTNSLMCVPLRVNERYIGAIEVVNHTADMAFDENDLNVLKLAGLLVSMAMDKLEKMVLNQENWS